MIDAEVRVIQTNKGLKVDFVKEFQSLSSRTHCASKKENTLQILNVTTSLQVNNHYFLREQLTPLKLSLSSGSAMYSSRIQL